MLDAGDADVTVYKDETGQYRDIKTGAPVSVRYAPSVGLEAVQKKGGQGGNGQMNSAVSKLVKNLSGQSNDPGKSMFSDSPGLGSYTQTGADGQAVTTTLAPSSTTSGSYDTGFNLSNGDYSLGDSYTGAANYNTPTTIDAGSVGTFDSASGSMGGGGESTGSSGGSGGSYTGAFVGALNGFKQGQKNADQDKKDNPGPDRDGFGTYHGDERAEIGGGFLGGVMGWYGGDLAGSVAGPVVKEVHPFFDDFTRSLITTGDDLGGVSGALALDPIGTMASGKYSWEDIIKGSLLGPASDWF